MFLVKLLQMYDIVHVAEMRGDVSIARQTSAYNMEGKSKSRIHAAGKDRQDNVIRMKMAQCIPMLDSQQHSKRISCEHDLWKNPFMFNR
jgi:hypothetical protein